MRWMLDTDTCIAVIKQHPHVLKKLRGKTVGQVGISSITLGELSFGAARSSRSKEAHEALADVLIALEVVGFDDACAMTYGSVRALLAQKGQPIGPLDTLIGSHALDIDVVLVTHNTREFSRIEGLRLEDWTEG